MTSDRLCEKMHVDVSGVDLLREAFRNPEKEQAPRQDHEHDGVGLCFNGDWSLCDVRRAMQHTYTPGAPVTAVQVADCVRAVHLTAVFFEELCV